MITDILEQRHPRCACIPIIRYCSRVRLSVACTEPCIHRVLDGCGSNSLQHCDYGRVRSKFSADAREHFHDVGCWFRPQSLCRGRSVVDVDLRMDHLKRQDKASINRSRWPVSSLRPSLTSQRSQQTSRHKTPILFGQLSIIGYAGRGLGPKQTKIQSSTFGKNSTLLESRHFPHHNDIVFE